MYDVESSLENVSAFSKYKGDTEVTYTLKAAIPYTTTEVVFKDVHESISVWQFVDFPGSLSTVVFPALVHLLCSIDKPSVRVTKKSLDPVAQFQGEESSDYREVLQGIAAGISLCATPIINVNPPQPIIYNSGNGAITVDQEKCILDNDPTSVQDMENTPCEIMTKDLNGKSIVDLTLPFLTEDEGVSACNFLYTEASHEYTEGSAVVDGMSVSASDLGKLYNGGVINRITWSYQDSSSFRANISYGSSLTGISSGSMSMYVQATDNALSREAIVIADKGNGYEFIVNVKTLGTFKAVSMILADISVGDTVNVTIYNNVAETRI